MAAQMEQMWKALYMNYTGDSTPGSGIPRDQLAKELADLINVVFQSGGQMMYFIQICCGRLIGSLFPSVAPLVSRKSSTFPVRRLIESEKPDRGLVPAFPNDLRATIMKELKEEMAGRRSATTPLSPNPTTPNINVIPTTPTSTNQILMNNILTNNVPSTPDLVKLETPPQIVVPETQSPPITTPTIPAASTSSGGTKRKTTTRTRSTKGSTKGRKKRKYTKNDDDSDHHESDDGNIVNTAQETPLSPSLLPNSSSFVSPTSVTSPLMSLPLPLPPSSSPIDSALYQEVQSFRVKMLAMQKEIHEIRSDYQKRERSWHREIQHLKQEIEDLREGITDTK